MGMQWNQTRARVPAVVGWDYEKVENGKAYKCFAAGPAIYLNTHRVGVTKPCLKKLTGGDLECPWCGIKTDWEGYFPWYSMTEYQRYFSILKPDMEDVAKGLELHQPVTLKRGKRVTAAVAIDTQPWTQVAPAFPADKATGVCLFDFLVHIWGHPGLQAYWAVEKEKNPRTLDAKWVVKPTDDEIMTMGAGEIVARDQKERSKRKAPSLAKHFGRINTAERNGTHDATAET